MSTTEQAPILRGAAPFVDTGECRIIFMPSRPTSCSGPHLSCAMDETALRDVAARERRLRNGKIYKATSK